MSAERPPVLRSYVMRAGRMTPAQRRAIERIGPRFLLSAPTRGRVDLAGAFGREAPVTVEVGFGAGDALLELAQACPERSFLGIDVYPPGAGRVLARLDEAGLTNVRLVMADAAEVLGRWLPARSVHEVAVWFPDPWPKKRHWKRRLIQAAFVESVARCLVPGGRFHLATDWEPYAHWMKEVVETFPEFELDAGSDGFSSRPDLRPRTRFEARGERLGHSVFDLVYRFEPRGAAPE